MEEGFPYPDLCLILQPSYIFFQVKMLKNKHVVAGNVYDAKENVFWQYHLFL